MNDKPKLTHVDDRGAASMVDTSEKDVTRRVARAAACVRMAAETARAIRDNQLAKGDVLAVARIAGIQAAKRTHELIPLCHPLALRKVEVELEVHHDDPRVEIRTLARADDVTGVEMEALTAASVAALTVYDMAKAIDREMRIEGVRLLHKSGGRSGTWNASDAGA